MVANEFIHLHYENFLNEKPEVFSNNLCSLLELTGANIHDLAKLKYAVQEIFNNFVPNSTNGVTSVVA